MFFKILLLIAVIVASVFLTNVITTENKEIKTELSEMENDINSIHPLSQDDLERSLTEALDSMEKDYDISEESVDGLRETIFSSVREGLNADENDSQNAWQLAREYASSDFEMANYYYLNALNKNPGKYEIWKDYVENALIYCSADELSLVYSNLDVGIISVDSINVADMVELKADVLDKIIILGMDTDDSQSSTVNNVAEDEDSSRIEEFIVACDSFLDLFNDPDSAADLINLKYAELSDEYYDIESARADAAFTNVSTVMSLLESIADLQDYGSYYVDKYESFTDLVNLLSVFSSTNASLQYTCSSLGEEYARIDSGMEKLAGLECDIEDRVISALQQLVKNKRPVLTSDNSDSVESLSEYQLYIQELLQLVGSQIDFYDILNNELIWITTSLNDISTDRQKKYQRWAYSVLVKVKDLNPKKCSRSDYDDYICIDTSLLIPELKVIYSDIYDNISTNLKSFDELIEYNSSMGLRKLEDF